MPIEDHFQSKLPDNKAGLVRRLVPVGLCLLVLGILRMIAMLGDPGSSDARPSQSASVCPSKDNGLRPLQIPKTFQARLEIERAGDPGHPIIVGRTNMPRGTKLNITLLRQASKYRAQSDALVDSRGCFEAGPFSQGNEPINGGKYQVNISTGVFDLQPAAVRAVLGDRGRNATGAAIQTTFNGARKTGRRLDYYSTLSLGSSDTRHDLTARHTAELVEDKQFENIRESSAIAAARALKNRLRNPTSADWVSVNATRDGSAVCIVLRAPNGFGGFSVQSYAVVDNGNQTRLMDWSAHCEGKNMYDLTRLVQASL
jgi:hypothetical protein